MQRGFIVSETAGQVLPSDSNIYMSFFSDRLAFTYFKIFLIDRCVIEA